MRTRETTREAGLTAPHDQCPAGRQSGWAPSSSPTIPRTTNNALDFWAEVENALGFTRNFLSSQARLKSSRA
jgi:hypothetical protein